MDKIVIEGGKPLNGDVKISGAKNSALPILFSTLLAEGEHKLSNVPNLADINFSLKILEALGAKTVFSNNEVSVEIGKTLETYAPYDLVRKMRASILTLGPLLSRFGNAKVSLPGGCAIGNRPIDLHLDALKKMGAEIEVSEGYVHAKCKRLKGAKIFFEFPTVGGTENILMAATLAEGETVIENAAREPEIEDLGNYLIAMGAEISGLGASTIKIQGRESLKASNHKVIADRIEAGTFVVAALMTKGKIEIQNIVPKHLSSFIEKIKETGAVIEVGESSLTVDGSNTKNLSPVKIVTAPYPGFPTDLQAQMMTLLTHAKGTSYIEENIFENRFMHVQELVRLGADISASTKSARVNGPSNLKGAPVMATDLRASASLVVAGLAAQGTTTVNRVYHLDRGYDNIEEKIRDLGGKISREK